MSLDRILDLSNGDNFSLQYTEVIPATLLATIAGRDYYAPITELIIPVVFDKPIILVNLSTSVPEGSKWKYAGNFIRLVSTAFGDCEVERRSLYLGKRNLIFFSRVDADYKLIYVAPNWFRDLNITIYQYDGLISSELEADLARIEAKIDALAS